MDDIGAIIKTIRVIGTEFADIADEELRNWIIVLGPTTSKKRFGKLYYLAVAYLVCHKMKMAGLGDTDMGTVSDSLRVSSYSEGSVSISFGGTQSGSSDTDAEYAMTVYGMQYLSLRKSVIVPIICSGESL